MLDLDAILAQYRHRCMNCRAEGHLSELSNADGGCRACGCMGWQVDIPDHVRDLIAEVERLRGQRQSPGATVSQEPSSVPFALVERTAVLQDDGSRIVRFVWLGNYPTQEAACTDARRLLQRNPLGVYEVDRDGVIVMRLEECQALPRDSGPPYAIVVHLQDGSEPPSGSYRTLEEAIREAKALYHGPLGQSAMYEVVDSKGVIVHVVSCKSEEKP